mmetsp:Transcript_18415/g.40399  ORF Transcript_18415/g.40399 Transcript_18415/m.40399 type:complete len:280 (-) Transcript_18415:10-849(-)
MAKYLSGHSFACKNCHLQDCLASLSGDVLLGHQDLHKVGHAVALPKKPRLEGIGIAPLLATVVLPRRALELGKAPGRHGLEIFQRGLWKRGGRTTTEQASHPVPAIVLGELCDVPLIEAIGSDPRRRQGGADCRCLQRGHQRPQDRVCHCCRATPGCLGRHGSRWHRCSRPSRGEGGSRPCRLLLCRCRKVLARGPPSLAPPRALAHNRLTPRPGRGRALLPWRTGCAGLAWCSPSSSSTGASRGAGTTRRASRPRRALTRFGPHCGEKGWRTPPTQLS